MSTIAPWGGVNCQDRYEAGGEVNRRTVGLFAAELGKMSLTRMWWKRGRCAAPKSAAPNTRRKGLCLY